MIRIWGGGYYEREEFYNLCTRLGFLVWQDFMFACGEYLENDVFFKNVIGEINDIILRLRNHPSITVYCGNNECEYFKKI